MRNVFRLLGHFRSDEVICWPGHLIYAVQWNICSLKKISLHVSNTPCTKYVYRLCTDFFIVRKFFESSVLFGVYGFFCSDFGTVRIFYGFVSKYRWPPRISLWNPNSDAFAQTDAFLGESVLSQINTAETSLRNRELLDSHT